MSFKVIALLREMGRVVCLFKWFNITGLGIQTHLPLFESVYCDVLLDQPGIERQPNLCVCVCVSESQHRSPLCTPKTHTFRVLIL